jgi:hypothetical protein
MRDDYFDTFRGEFCHLLYWMLLSSSVPKKNQLELEEGLLRILKERNVQGDVCRRTPYKEHGRSKIKKSR